MYSALRKHDGLSVVMHGLSECTYYNVYIPVKFHFKINDVIYYAKTHSTWKLQHLSSLSVNYGNTCYYQFEESLISKTMFCKIKVGGFCTHSRLTEMQTMGNRCCGCNSITFDCLVEGLHQSPCCIITLLGIY